jgi:hypothetical protein
MKKLINKVTGFAKELGWKEVAGLVIVAAFLAYMFLR